MKYAAKRMLLVVSMLPCAPVLAISMVYNFRIAQITKQLLVEKPDNKSHTVVALLFDQYRKKQTGVHQNFIGGLGSFIYDAESYYFRTDFAASHIKENSNDSTTFSGTETDDILFTAGRTVAINNKTGLTFSGLFGIPTHRIFRLQHTDFGYSQIGTGVQCDGSYEFSKISTLLYGGRYIHFIPRNARDSLEQEHRFTLGNIADLLFAYKSKWERHGFECGYTVRSRFGAHISPNLDDTVQKTNYLRSNFYGVYKYRFSINEVSNRLLFYISYGFDHTPKLFGNKYIVTLWTSWNISF